MPRDVSSERCDERQQSIMRIRLVASGCISVHRLSKLQQHQTKATGNERAPADVCHTSFLPVGGKSVSLETVAGGHCIQIYSF